MNPLGLIPDRFVVAEQDSQPVGFCQLAEHGTGVAELRSLFVEESARCVNGSVITPRRSH